jgi:hypothetical protein
VGEGEEGEEVEEEEEEEEEEDEEDEEEEEEEEEEGEEGIEKELSARQQSPDKDPLMEKHQPPTMLIKIAANL